LAITRIQTKYELEKAQLQECTFTPAINPDSVAIVEGDKNYKPIHQRLGEIQVGVRRSSGWVGKRVVVVVVVVQDVLIGQAI